jgi:protein tyrosine phosphatase (PTP) superfamily phosphohydrolase (DUF442 family)
VSPAIRIEGQVRFVDEGDGDVEDPVVRTVLLVLVTLGCASCRSSDSAAGTASQPGSETSTLDVSRIPPELVAADSAGTTSENPSPGASLSESSSEVPRDAKSATDAAWAERVVRPGLPNLWRVSPVLYRGAQPEAEGFAELGRLGVRTVVSLRAFHSDPSDVGDLRAESISFKFWHPEDEDVARFLRIVTDPANQPVFVHCQHGSDRTGMMIAIWRIAVEGWTKDEALREMTSGPYGYHENMAHLVRYVRNADVAELCRRAGIACAPARHE